MNKQILRKISLIILPLLVIGVATYFLITSNTKEVKALVNSSGAGSAFDLFKSYQTWPTSGVQKTGTDAEWLHAMNPTFGNTVIPAQNVDINGDGLVDILVHAEFQSISGGWSFYYGVLLNRGDRKFDLVYKCVYITAAGPDKFYGDCAAL